MSTPPKKGKQPGKPSADPGKVTKILAEARQVVDDLGGATAGAPVRQKKSPAAGGERPRQSRAKAGTAKKPAARRQAPAATKATAPRKPAPSPAKAKKPAPSPAAAPLLSPRECGISVVHTLPGRIRFRIRSLQYDAEFARELEARLAAIKGITEAGASPATGSLLISYTSKKVVAAPFGKAMQAWFPRLDTESLLAVMPE